MKVRLLSLLMFYLCSLLMSAKNITVIGMMVNGKMTINQRDFMTPNSNYVIKQEFDLDGKKIVLPPNSRLTFLRGGILKNGSLLGNESDITASQGMLIFTRMTIEGTWKVSDIFSNWFDFGNNTDWNTKNMQSICNLTSDKYKGNIYISKGLYKINVTNTNNSCMNVNSNTNVTIDGTIELQPCNKLFYGIIRIVDEHDVIISGKGRIIGDVERHYGETGEWGMGIDIWSSKNVTIKGIMIEKCWGDCIYIGQSKNIRESYPENIIIDNVACVASRRQGLSIITGKNIYVKNCSFKDTGSIKFTAPGAGVDLEPNQYGETVFENINITNCVFKNNYNNKDLSSHNLDKSVSVLIKECSFEGGIVMHDKGYNVTFDQCDINRIIYISRENTGNIVFRNTKIRTEVPKHLLILRIIKIVNSENPRKKSLWGLSFGY